MESVDYFNNALLTVIQLSHLAQEGQNLKLGLLTSPVVEAPCVELNTSNDTLLVPHFKRAVTMPYSNQPFDLED